MNGPKHTNTTNLTDRPPEDGGREASWRSDPGEKSAEALARKALLSRPGVSIRTRFIIGFLVVFVVATGATMTAWGIIARLDNKLEFVERADKIANEIQQCRRYEKNYLLYGTSLDKVLKHLNSARTMLVGAKTELGKLVGVERMEKLEADLEAYSDLIFQLLDTHKDLRQGESLNEPAIENKLRLYGARIVDTALLMSREERSEVRRELHRMRQLTMIALAFLLVAMIYMANYMSRLFLRRLDFLTGVTKRIGEGDFTPIMPVRKYRDEFTKLSLAMNRMMSELVSRQEQLVQARKIAAVGTLTAGIAHEINNPVNNISLILESMVENPETMEASERQRLTREAMYQCDRVSDIVRNLLEFSRSSHPRLEHASLEELVDRTVRLISNELDLNRIKFTKKIQDQLPDLHVDKGGLQQVLLNLFLNSIQAMPDGGELEVVVQLTKAMNEARIDVRDTGQGIPPEHLANVFDPFYSTKKDGEGTGLGLSVSHSIIEKHGGRMEVQSTQGKGTVFSIFLPFERPAF